MIFRPAVIAAFAALGFAGAALAGDGLTEHEKAVHLFDRLAYGPRPGDIEKLEKGGSRAINAWLEAQLHPETIDDSDVDRKCQELKAPTMSSAQLLLTYPHPQEVAAMMGIDKERFQKDEQLKKQIRQKIGEDHLPEAIVKQLTANRLVRAVESRRQLQEVLTDFWLNHFNIDIGKGEEKWLLPDFERTAIRTHEFGKFRDLLGATARHPAMLFYLDNQNSRVPGPRGQGGINENYAREILELHTLGVDGGYTQADVTELARILTGWSIDDIRTAPVFLFRDKAHDKGVKRFLGLFMATGGGQEEGERALDLIARHPSTAHFISLKLARYFVADNPPPALVARMAEAFRRTDGDLRAVYRELFESPEFWSRQAYRAKIKKPVQFVVSAVRTLGGEIDLESPAVGRALAMMGEDLYKCAPPTGYRDNAETWVNPGAMVSRLNFAVRLAADRIDGAMIELPQIQENGRAPSDAGELVRIVEGKLLHERLAATSEQVILREFESEPRTMADGEVRPMSMSKAVGLVIGSPEFQRR